jgi:hypothetical protein
VLRRADLDPQGVCSGTLGSCGRGGARLGTGDDRLLVVLFFTTIAGAGADLDLHRRVVHLIVVLLLHRPVIHLLVITVIAISRADLVLLHRRVASNSGGINDGDGSDDDGSVGGGLGDATAERECDVLRSCCEPSELMRLYESSLVNFLVRH